MALTTNQIFLKVLGIDVDRELQRAGDRPQVPCWIVNLAKSMADTTGLRVLLRGHIDAGYTYLGQLISHDIVPPTGSGGHGRPVSPKLSLDSLYGPSKTKPSYLNNGRFELAEGGHDLARDAGKAQIPEPRNDDNLIIAQLQVLWQRLHNAILDSKSTNSEAEAREDVIKIFQCVVVEDYLRQILDPRVYKFCIVEGESCFPFNGSRLDPLFTHAAFRFGHSMVRDFYDMQQGVGLHLSQLFRPNEEIPKKHQISWDKFFSNDGHAQPSDSIDTLVAVDMSSIPPIDEKSPAVNILIANIFAGWKANLPTGHDLVMDLIHGWNGLKRPPPALGLNRISTDRIDVFGMKITELPLWPYILLEAEIHRRGISLGVLGSLIVAETIRNSIKAASPSIFQGTSYKLGVILSSMGKLGSQLKQIIESNRRSEFDDRPLTMAHILVLLDQLENSK